MLVVILVVGYWLVSPLWRNKKLDEALPGVTDKLSGMDQVTKDRFNSEVEAIKDNKISLSDVMPDNSPSIVKESSLKARAHEVQGKAILVKTGDSYLIRLENLKTINGPDLRIYLSSDLSDGDYIDLGSIKATEGNVNYRLPAGVDVSKYKNVLIWCRAFGVLFSYAQL